MILYSVKTDIGQRKANEDSYFVDQELGLYIVADGVGGLAKGEVASQLTCETICSSVKQGKSLEEAVLDAHTRILDETKSNEKLKGMASTVIVAQFTGNTYDLAWIGDSRAYLWDGELKLITRDHSYVELLLETGHITYQQMKTHPDKNVISQALGIERKKLRVATNKGTLEKGQLLMLSSDGLYEVTEEIQVIKQINRMSNIKSLTKKLVNYAVNSEGKDNITLLTIQSDANTENEEQVIVPLVIREFDSETGEVKVSSAAGEIDSSDETVNIEKKVKNIVARALDVEGTTPDQKINILEMILMLFIIVSILIITTLNL